MILLVRQQKAAGKTRRVFDRLQFAAHVVGGIKRHHDRNSRAIHLFERDACAAADTFNLTNSCDENANSPQRLIKHLSRPNKRVLRFPSGKPSQIVFSVKHSLLSSVTKCCRNTAPHKSAVAFVCNPLRVVSQNAGDAYKCGPHESGSHAGVLWRARRRGLPLPVGRHAGSGMIRALIYGASYRFNGCARRALSVCRPAALAIERSFAADPLVHALLGERAAP